MSTDLLFEQFATFVTAPEGIARLRELILQLAVQGKLGTQDAGDEPASALLEKIKKEKKQLVKEGKIKRENIIPTTQENESPYPLPKGWKWATLNDVFLDIRSGGTPSKNNPQFWDGDIYWASVKDLKDRKYLESTQDKITQKGLEECRSKLIPPGNLIICVRMGLGKIAINKVHLAINQDLKAADLSKNIDINFFYNFYRAQTVKGTGMTVDGIRQEKLLQMPFPLPPLTEQHRIVAKVDRLMAICDELEARQQQERAGCLKLGTASLAGLQNAESPEEFGRKWAMVCDAFDLILDCPENVAVLRQTILQLAAQGRLVRQEPGDEPAKKLVDRIRKEKERLVKEGKIKRDSRLELIDKNVIGQSFPQNWVLTRLGDIAYYNAEIKVSSEEISEDAWVFDLEDIEKDTSRILQKVRFKDRQSLSSKSRFKKGDVLYGKLRPYLNKVVVADEDGYCTTEIVPIRPFLDIDPKYLMYALKTPGFLAYVNSKTYGIKMPRLGTVDAINTVIPLPPLAEQHRIVAKVDALMELCDALESRLKERAGVQERLAGAVVKQVAG